MRSGIRLEKIWFDDDCLELRITILDSNSTFSNKAYVAHSQFVNIVGELDVFRNHIHDGIYDLEFGKFGPEYANGALSARLHFKQPGRVFISCRSQSEFRQFGVSQVANETVLYLCSEPVLLDRFIGELKQLLGSIRDDATLVAIEDWS